MKDIIRQVKKHWKVLSAVAVILTVSVIGMTILFANDVVLTMTAVKPAGVDDQNWNENKMTWTLADIPPSLKAEVTSSDDSVENVKITWSSDATEVVAISPIQ